MPKINVRKGMPSVQLSKEEFATRFRDRFYDPAFARSEAELGKVIEIAWNAYNKYRKSPRTRPAGRGFADPTYAAWRWNRSCNVDQKGIKFAWHIPASSSMR
jgi:hypothetical protein